MDYIRLELAGTQQKLFMWLGTISRLARMMKWKSSCVMRRGTLITTFVFALRSAALSPSNLTNAIVNFYQSSTIYAIFENY